ncbi:MAG: integration host factor subunit alpha [Mailhella sp.]|nr:integration host factor subunit alpha [Mailhella sp.]
MNKALTKADIVEAVYNQTERNRTEVKGVVESLLDIMKQAIKKDHALLISGFGKFEAYDKDARRGRNPQTNEAITLPPRCVVVFRLSRKFRAELNGEVAFDD